MLCTSCSFNLEVTTDEQHEFLQFLTAISPANPTTTGSAEGSGIATAHKDPNGVMLVQPYTSSQGTKSLVVDEMQEVEL
jgi:hypothetical protein